MAKASPILRSFNAGEFSRLMDGRSDIDRSPSSMRKLRNYIAAPQGPAIGRSGTTFITPVYDETKRSAIIPFLFSEEQAYLLEFADMKMRVILEDGPLLSGPDPYEIDTPWDEFAVSQMRFLQSGDVVYLFCDGFQPRKLTRLGATNYELALHETLDGPFLPINETGTRLTPSTTGAITMTETVTAGPANQTVTIEYDAGAPTTITGYYLQANAANDSADYTSLDYAPSDWTLEGWTGSVWELLDQKKAHVLYDNKRTPFFPVKVGFVYQKYRIAVTALRRNGPIQPGFKARFAAGGTVITITASGVIGINKNQGFLPTDVGRLIRYKNVSDSTWAALKIIGWTSSTVVTVVAQSAPLGDAQGSTEWRLGYWSDTTGWPTCGTFFEDRLWLGGSVEYPDVIAGSRTGAYDDLAQTTEAGIVADDSAVVFQLNSRKISRIAWLQSDERGLLVGTGSGEWVVTAANRDDALTARSIKARNSTARGSARIEPVKVDRAIIFVQRSKRTAREFVYVFEADGYKSPSMSLFASHIGVDKFAEMDFAAEPHSIIWFRRDDGLVAGLTYNRDENVVGWHLHNFADGIVESLAVVPSSDGKQDALWIVVNRDVAGVSRRFIERMSRFWDFDMTLADAHLVDCALRYQGAPANFITGLGHLEGAEVYGLADGSPFEAVVVGGAIELASEASNVIVGLPYDAVGVTNRLEAGATDGTSQGKTKRIHKAVVRTWQSVGGMVGRAEDDLVEIASRRTEDLSSALPLRDEDHIVEWPNGYDGDCFVAFKRDGKKPLPFNVIAIMPQVVTQDAR
jgi:hypothetical protein